MNLRKLIFWLHLFAGLIAGVVIAIMSATGIAIAFEEEILRFYDRKVSRLSVVPPHGTARLSVNELRGLIQEKHPEFQIQSFTVSSDPARAWEFSAGHEGLLYVDPYSGAIQETRTHEIHEILHTLEEWHRWLGASDGLTSTGRLITGICNLMFVVLCVTGLYLWFPRRWSLRALKPLLLFQLRFKGKARDYNWHNVFGFWSLPFLLILTITAVAISFEWGHKLVFTLAGEEAPKSRNYGMMAVPPPTVPTPAEGATHLPFEASVAKAAATFPDWEIITLYLPSPDQLLAPLTLGVTVPDHMPSRAYIPLESDPFTGEILQQVHFEDRSPGLQARVWMRFLHTGGAFGVPGKIIASLASAAALVLVWTGFALSYRRFFGTRGRPKLAA